MAKSHADFSMVKTLQKTTALLNERKDKNARQRFAKSYP